MRLIDFKLAVADTLFSYKAKHIRLRERPNLENQIIEKRRKPNAHTGPPKHTRLDMTDHWSIMEKKGRCKLPNCKGQTKMFGSKCKVNLCLTGEKNYIFDYHH